VSWIPASTTVADGTYSVIFRTADVAGNQSQETRTIKVDTTDPVITETITGTSGAGGWYVSDVTVDTAISDSTSGVFGEEMRVDGGAWIPVGSPTLTDGTHTVEYRVEDEAGNIGSRTVAVNVDTTPPIASASATGTMGANGWYTTNVELDLTSSDTTSGVAVVEYQDGGLWSPYAAAITLANGTHDIRFRVTDTAGNVTLTAPTTYRVDTTPPDMDSALSGNINADGWSNGTVELTGSADDLESGLLSFEVNINGAGWVDAAAADLEFTSDGIYEIRCRATDTAGNFVEDTITVQVDTTPPESAFSSPPEGATVTVTEGVITLSGGTTDNLSGVRMAEMSLNGGTTWRSLSSNENWSYTLDTTTLPNGTHTILVRAVDNADNPEHTARVTLVIENDRPVIEVPSSWYIWEEAPLRVYSDDEITEVRIRIYDAEDRWEYYKKYDFIPEIVPWNRIFGFDRGGQPIHAPPGTYQVEIIARNERSRESTAYATIIIPDGGGGALWHAGLTAITGQETEPALVQQEQAEVVQDNAVVEAAEIRENTPVNAQTGENIEVSSVPAEAMAEQGAEESELQAGDNRHWMPALGLLLILLGLLLAFGMRVLVRRLEGQEDAG
jgi:hypothetical protein